jgi:hypothetical protein
VRLPPHWRKAPGTLLFHRPVLAAVVFGSFLVALAAASGPLFTASAGVATFRDALKDIPPLAAGLEYERIYEETGDPNPPPGFQATKPQLGLHTAPQTASKEAEVRGIPLLGAPIVTTMVPARQLTRVGGGLASYTVVVMARTHALDHVRRLAGNPSRPGAWVPDTVAKDLHLRPGSRIEVPLTTGESGAKSVRVRVAGIYRALWKQPQTPFWINFYKLIYATDYSDPVLPPPFVFVPQAFLEREFATLDPANVTQRWEFPIVGHDITLTRARTVARALTRIQSVHGHESTNPYQPTSGTVVLTSLPQAVGLADKTMAAVEPPTRLLADAGALIALLVVGASGVFLVVRRRAEARTLFARGERASSFAARTLLEALLPSLVGGALGFVAALELIHVFQPHGTVESGGIASGLRAAGLGVAVGLLLLGGAAGVSFARQYEVGGRAHPVLRRLPWELLALAGGVALLLRVRAGGGLVKDTATGLAHPSLASFLVPILLVAGGSALVARLGARPLRRLAGGAARRGVVPLLALRRLAAGKGVLALLLVTCASALSLLLYAQALVASVTDAAAQKAYIAVGSDVQVVVPAAAPAPRHLSFPVTRVESSYGSAAFRDGDTVDIEAVDPATLAAALHWNPDWGPPVERLVDALRSPGKGIPVVLAGSTASPRTLEIGSVPFRIRVVAHVRAFPGMTSAEPLVVLSRTALTRAGGGVDPLDPPWAYLWARGPTNELLAKLTVAPIQGALPTTAQSFRRDPSVVLALRTFSYSRALGIAAGALALLCLVLYLVARQRAQTIATAFGGRMGLRRTAAALALALELGAIVAVALAVAVALTLPAARIVVGHSDPLGKFPPAPEFVPPWLALGAIGAVLAAASLLAGVVASRPPRDAAVMGALRLE